mmetsp:Transcript_2025/g.4175  ORF Transcript_2025/g.4175 Transcript_2025/m.4175 type:complete len:273 (+) Transcript_2025:124-942(+)
MNSLARAAAFLSCTVAVASGAECPDLDMTVAIPDSESVLNYAMVGATDGTPGYLCAQLVAGIEGWVGVGFTNTGKMTNDGTGWAVIGTGGDGGSVQNYRVDGYSEPTPLDSQTLMDTSLTVADGVTTMTFTKYLVEDGQQPIYEIGENKGIHAGLDGSDQLAYHSGGYRFEFNLIGEGTHEETDHEENEDASDTGVEAEEAEPETETTPTEAHSHEGHSHEETEHEDGSDAGDEAPAEVPSEPVAEPEDGDSGAGHRSVGLAGAALAAALLA